MLVWGRPDVDRVRSCNISSYAINAGLRWFRRYRVTLPNRWLSESVPGGMFIVIWPPHHKGLSASHGHPGTSVADGARRLDGAQSLLGGLVTGHQEHALLP